MKDKMEARTGWGDLHTDEIAVVAHLAVGFDGHEVGISLGRTLPCFERKSLNLFSFVSNYVRLITDLRMQCHPQ